MSRSREAMRRRAGKLCARVLQVVDVMEKYKLYTEARLVKDLIKLQVSSNQYIVVLQDEIDKLKGQSPSSPHSSPHSSPYIKNEEKNEKEREVEEITLPAFLTTPIKPFSK